MNVFDQMMSRYEIITDSDYANAIHEVMQQVALAGLYRGTFFEKAAFYGGTCLRIFHGTDRFSEDMDFSLLNPEKEFSLELYFPSIINEFKSVGRDVEIIKKNKTLSSNIESAFLKDDTAEYDLHYKPGKRIKIKIEVDINPPIGFETEFRLMMMPFSFLTRCYTLPDLFAGKMHAFLFRTWKNRVKGRDWYDLEWYVRNNVALNFSHFCSRVAQSAYSEKVEFTKESLKSQLKEKIVNTDIRMVKSDVGPFIRNYTETEIWSNDYFVQIVDMIKFV